MQRTLRAQLAAWHAMSAAAAPMARCSMQCNPRGLWIPCSLRTHRGKVQHAVLEGVQLPGQQDELAPLRGAPHECVQHLGAANASRHRDG